ncbi:hypothetical protein DN545_36200 [Burkholderia multivorans]|nr:hypothetical protein DN545_36200 [Burkholderia multivorans]
MYWKRRYSHPVSKDWVLLGCLAATGVAAACAFIDFRLGAFVLAAVPGGLALMRSMPSPWGEFWVNRSKGVDIVTCLIFTALLVGIAIVVPQSR